MSRLPLHPKTFEPKTFEIGRQKRSICLIPWLFAVLSLASATSSPAANEILPLPKNSFTNSFYEKQEAEIPSRPSTPPTLVQKPPTDIPHCERYFLYQGRRIECDSNVTKDASRLRLVMSDVPGAIAELDAYQAGREKTRITAYTGTLGVVAMVVGILISHPPFDPTTGALQPGGYVLIGGLGITAGSLVYGLSTTRSNEGHLDHAVKTFNTAHPERPIELQFSTNF